MCLSAFLCSGTVPGACRCTVHLPGPHGQPSLGRLTQARRGSCIQQIPVVCAMSMSATAVEPLHRPCLLLAKSEQFRVFVATETAKWRRAAREANIKLG